MAMQQFKIRLDPQQALCLFSFYFFTALQYSSLKLSVSPHCVYFPNYKISKWEYLFLTSGQCIVQCNSFECGSGVFLLGLRPKLLLIVCSWAGCFIALSSWLRIYICAHFTRLLFKINKIMHVQYSTRYPDPL